MKIFVVITQACVIPPYIHLDSCFKFFYENRVRLSLECGISAVYARLLICLGGKFLILAPIFLSMSSASV